MFIVVFVVIDDIDGQGTGRFARNSLVERIEGLGPGTSDVG